MTDSIPSMTLAHRLRGETAQAHVALEAGLGFDIHQPDAKVAVGMLESFYRILQVFEPAMLALLPPQLRSRSRLAILQTDLTRLGSDTATLSSPHSIWLPKSSAEAMGALYVMEGSTLGGKVIAKALRRLSEWPLRGKSYFDPYESETGAMWAAFQLQLAGVPEHEWDAVVNGANQTFGMLDAAMTNEVRA